jgi:hypothetical protein
MLNEPIDDAASVSSGSSANSASLPAAGGAGGNRPPGGSYITVTPQEREAIERVSFLI